jgi:hypothetical protein
MKQTYVLRDGKLVPKAEAAQRSGFFVMPDITPFVTAGDNVPISSRSQLRAYEQANGVKRVGNDLPIPTMGGRE